MLLSLGLCRWALRQPPPVTQSSLGVSTIPRGAVAAGHFYHHPHGAATPGCFDYPSCGAVAAGCFDHPSRSVVALSDSTMPWRGAVFGLSQFCNPSHGTFVSYPWHFGHHRSAQRRRRRGGVDQSAMGRQRRRGWWLKYHGTTVPWGGW